MIAVKTKLDESMKVLGSQPRSTLSPPSLLILNHFSLLLLENPAACSLLEASLILMLPDFDAELLDTCPRALI